MISNQTHALDARSLTLSWDGSMIVVKDLSLQVDKGQIICLVGRSGCGKTTLLHALAGLTKPMTGQVFIDGKDCTGKPGLVSYMQQKDLLLPSLTVLDNICMPLVLNGMSKAEAREQAASYFPAFGLVGTADCWPCELSGGMRQRAAFLRTYLMGNSVVLLDEPFSALDAITRTELRSWFCAKAHELGLAVLAITHDPDEAVVMSERVLVLSGASKKGVPSTLAQTIEVAHGKTSFEGFSLSQEYIDAKRAVVESLA